MSLTILGADHMKVNLFCVGCTMIVSAVKMTPDTGVGLLGRSSAAGAGSFRRSQ